MITAWWFLGLVTCAVLSGATTSLVCALQTCSRIRLSSLIQDREETPSGVRAKLISEDLSGHASAVALFGYVFKLGLLVSCVFWITSLRELETPGLLELGIGAALSVGLLWVIATLIPMAIAQHAGERSVIVLSRSIRILYVACFVILPAWKFTNEVVRRLAGPDVSSKDGAKSVTDLRAIVEDDDVQEQLDETERDMLEAVVEFRSTSVEQIMTPRTEINAIEYTDDLSVVESFINEHGHSRLPVFSENLDHIEGMLYAKDLLKWMIANNKSGKPFILRELLREPSFVPETKTVRELLSQLLSDQVHIAVILDEYGGTSGLVTMEDIVEEIFGEIQDEYEEPEDESTIVIDEIAEQAEIDARTEIDDANDELEPLGIQLPESDDYDTVGGFINTVLGRIPENGEVSEHQELKIEILEAEPTRVIRLRISKIVEGQESESDNAEPNKADIAS